MTDRLEGRVVEFDEHKGYGWVEAEDGRRLFFHCTAVASRTRSIPEGTVVTFDVVPGHLGRWEAARLVPSSPASGLGTGSA